MTFIVETSLYCYKVMSFVLKNVEATNQHLVNKVFAALIRKIVEVHIDDMTTKSVKEVNHVIDIEEIFKVLRHHKTKLNPKKCRSRKLIKIP